MKKFVDYSYQRPDVEGVERSLREVIAGIANAVDAETQLENFRKYDRILRDFANMFTVASIRQSIDTNDEFYNGEIDFFNENLPSVEALQKEVQKAILNTKFRNELEDSLGKYIFEKFELESKTVSDEVLDLLVEEAKLTTEYDKLIASAQIEFRGEVQTLSRLNPFRMSADRETRRDANEAYFGFFEENLEQFDEIFDKLVKTRNEIAITLGYENFVDLGYARLARTDYKSSEVKVFRDKIVEHLVPLASELMERQRERIGVDSLKYYDESVMFLSGNAEPHGDPDWIMERGRELYERLGEVPNEFFNFMSERNLFDLLSKDGKMAGGYCTFVDAEKSPFIFANFNGTADDVDVLTHEAGHALQMYLSRDIPYLDLFMPGYEAAEIHSMSMEFLAYPHIELFFEDEAEKYKYAHIADNLKFLPYDASIDEFQHYVYENPNASPEERRAMYREIERKYYPNKDYDGNEFLEGGGFWMRQGHVYQTPFYYIDYTLALICAFQFWMKSMEDYNAAMDDYIALCRLGGTKSFLGLVESAGLKSPFEGDTLKDITKSVEKYLNSIDDTKIK